MCHRLQLPQMRDMAASKQLQVQNNRVDRIFHLVGDAARDPSAGGDAARQFDFIFSAACRFRVTHGEQRADLSSLLLNEIE